MSKLTPLGQSMAALFTPEGENLRSSAKDGSSSVRSSGQAFKVPGTEALKEGDKPQDSLGNPNSPGYSPLGLKKTGAAGEPGTTEGEGAPAPGIKIPFHGSQFIRLGFGWEKILLAQKKACEKAKGLFTLLEGPSRYRSQRKTSFLEQKSRGAILDVDVEELRAETEAQEKKKAA